MQPRSPSSRILKIGSPQILFHPQIPSIPWDLGSFDVARDGKRFLVNTFRTSEPSRLP